MRGNNDVSRCLSLIFVGKLLIHSCHSSEIIKYFAIYLIFKVLLNSQLLYNYESIIKYLGSSHSHVIDIHLSYLSDYLYVSYRIRLTN